MTSIEDEAIRELITSGTAPDVDVGVDLASTIRRSRRRQRRARLGGVGALLAAGAIGASSIVFADDDPRGTVVDVVDGPDSSDTTTPGKDSRVIDVSFLQGERVAIELPPGLDDYRVTSWSVTDRQRRTQLTVVPGGVNEWEANHGAITESQPIGNGQLVTTTRDEQYLILEADGVLGQILIRSPALGFDPYDSETIASLGSAVSLSGTLDEPRLDTDSEVFDIEQSSVVLHAGDPDLDLVLTTSPCPTAYETSPPGKATRCFVDAGVVAVLHGTLATSQLAEVDVTASGEG